MKKKIKDLTIEELAKFCKLGCPKCPLNEIECVNICADVWKFITWIEDEDEEVEL